MIKKGWKAWCIWRHVSEVAVSAGTMWSPHRGHAFRGFVLLKCVSRGPHFSFVGFLSRALITSPASLTSVSHNAPSPATGAASFPPPRVLADPTGRWRHHYPPFLKQKGKYLNKGKWTLRTQDLKDQDPKTLRVLCLLFYHFSFFIIKCLFSFIYLFILTFPVIIGVAAIN